MAPQWNTTDRGQNRADDSTDMATDYDAWSCMYLGPDPDLRDVESVPWS